MGGKHEFEDDGCWTLDVGSTETWLVDSREEDGGQTAAYKRFYISDERHTNRSMIQSPGWPAQLSVVMASQQQERATSSGLPPNPGVPHCGTQGVTMPIHQSCWACWAHALRWHCTREPRDIAAWTNHSKASTACFLFSAALVIGGYDVLVFLQLAQVASGLGNAGAGVLSGSAVPCFQRGIRLFGHRTRCRRAVTAMIQVSGV